MPVMLTYFEGNELMPVLADYPDYDHLMNHVAVQLDSNEFQLYRTPVVLTLQGEFEVTACLFSTDVFDLIYFIHLHYVLHLFCD